MMTNEVRSMPRTLLVVVDVQEAFRSAVPEFELVTSRIALAVRSLALANVPVLITEQYPKGLGRTAEEILLSLPENAQIIEKTAFSAARSEEFIDKLRDGDVERVLLCGIEAHICVCQTAIDLLDRGIDVHILTDCVASRFEHDKQAALTRLSFAGAIQSSAEMALFEVLRDSKHPNFREIQSLIK
jgi:nicotinamidase-related amidase